MTVIFSNIAESQLAVQDLRIASSENVPQASARRLTSMLPRVALGRVVWRRIQRPFFLFLFLDAIGCSMLRSRTTYRATAPDTERRICPSCAGSPLASSAPIGPREASKHAENQRVGIPVSSSKFYNSNEAVNPYSEPWPPPKVAPEADAGFARKECAFPNRRMWCGGLHRGSRHSRKAHHAVSGASQDRRKACCGRR